ncbi:hypothetical protein [Sphingomonas metalli]|nr:hypothetical protein [Sphingomonas metalli]
MAHAKMFGRYALTAATLIGGFTFASLSAWQALGWCQHTMLR